MNTTAGTRMAGISRLALVRLVSAVAGDCWVTHTQTDT
jgi:hypothetical protein